VRGQAREPEQASQVLAPVLRVPAQGLVRALVQVLPGPAREPVQGQRLV
jgi:hypothetical protein